MVETGSRVDDVLISVIMPCYNGAETLRWTVNSVLRQSYANLELICVDDQSSDGTVELLKQLAVEDKRIVVLEHEHNTGPGVARNTGVVSAKGDLVAFIDADDTFEVDFIERLHCALQKNDADIAQCGIRYIFDTRSHAYKIPSGLIAGEHCRYRIDINDGIPFVSPHPTNKLYRRHLFSTVTYKSIYYEDTEIVPSLLQSVNRIVNVDEPLYNYNKRYSGRTGGNKMNPARLEVQLEAIILSAKPYVADNFDIYLDKWGVEPPRAIVANLSNLLKGIKNNLQEYTAKDIVEADKLLESFTRSFVDVLPSRYLPSAYGVLNTFANDVNCPLTKAEIGKSAAMVFGRRSFWSKQRLAGWFEKRMGVVDRFLPKRGNRWIFASWGRYAPHTVDNPRAVFEHIKDDPNIEKVILLNSNKHDPRWKMPKGIRIKYQRLQSLAGLYSMMTAGRIYTGYACHGVFGYRRLYDSPKRKIIQLWHGIPIKKIGLSVKTKLEPFWSSETPRYHALIASSTEDRQVMVKSFSPLNEEKVKLTGLPRHDFLAMPQERLPKDYQQHLNLIERRLDGRPLLLFAPTWRRGSEEPCMFSTEEFIALDRLFAEYNAVLGVRLHPNMMRGAKYSSFVSDNVFYFNDIPDVNVLLRLTDALVTDYSSIYLDYMKLKRPVLLYHRDLRNYRSGRGLNYDLGEFKPHDFLIDSFDGLKMRLKDVLDETYVLDSSYQSTLQRFHHFELDADNSKRVLEACGG